MSPLFFVNINLFSVQFRNYEEEENKRIKKEGQICSKDIFFIEQTIGNACGTIGLLHALGNCQDQIHFGMSTATKVCSRYLWV